MRRVYGYCCTLLLVGGLVDGGALADVGNAAGPVSTNSEHFVGVVDNLFINGAAGVEGPPGEGSTGFGLLGANWGIPLTQPDGVALGLQLAASGKLRDNDPEGNFTFGGFGRNFPTLADQQGAAALLVDYQRTALHHDVWDLRPIIGTTVTRQDGVGAEGVAQLNTDRGQSMVSEFTFFWTRDWADDLATEFGLGYQFSHVDEALLRGRLAVGVTSYIDMGIGGDLNTNGDYAFGVTASYHFGGTGRHAFLHNIGGSGAGLYTPFPDASFPSILHRTR
ncbi:MAG TPA: hypothetical protein VMV72_07285 [Verrucomicrobiae bacterium]|nr:hypothetical protein [Verrucomicrobiae bacterium]